MSAPKKPSSAKVVNQAPEAAAPPVADFFTTLGKRAPLILLGVLFVIAFIVFKDYLLLNKVYFFKDIGSDSYNSSYPSMYQAADYIAKYGVPKWSFNFGMGQSIFPFFLRDPFDIFLYLGGKDHIAYATIFKELVKVLLTGLIFFYYLKTLKLSDYTAMIGSMLFAFCGFMIVGGAWYYFSFETFNMALLLLSFELLRSKQNWYLFPIAIFLICISQPFNLYVYGLFLAFYAILRHLQSGPFNGKDIALLFGKMAGLGILGMLLSGPFLLENILQLLESPRGSGASSYAHYLSSSPMFATADKTQMGTSILRFFSDELLGNGNDFKGSLNYLEAPLFYCGIPCLLLMPQVFQFLEKRVKIVFGISLGVWLIPMVFPYFRYAFWLFTGDYYRAYALILAFVFLYYSLMALDLILQKRKINLVVLIVTVVLLMVLLNYPYFPDKDVVVPGISIFVVIMIFAYSALLYFITKQNNPYLKYAFFAVVMLELTYLSYRSANDRDAGTAAEIEQRKSYNDHTVEAIKYLKDHDHSFFRIDKNYGSSPAMHESINDGLVQGYYGTSTYNPFNQEHYVKYSGMMGLIDLADETQSRWIIGFIERPILQSENHVKYILAKNGTDKQLWRIFCDSVTTIGDVSIFRNRFALPFGYTYNHYIKESVFKTLTSTQRDFTSMKTCVIKDADVPTVTGMQEFQLKDTLPPFNLNFVNYRQFMDELIKDTMVVSAFGNTHIAGKINVSEPKMVYISVPYDGGWQLKVDGQTRAKMILSGGMTGVMLSNGPHTIEMDYDLRLFGKGVIMMLVGLVLYAALWFVTKRKENVLPEAH